MEMEIETEMEIEKERERWMEKDQIRSDQNFILLLISYLLLTLYALGHVEEGSQLDDEAPRHLPRPAERVQFIHAPRVVVIDGVQLLRHGARGPHHVRPHHPSKQLTIHTKKERKERSYMKEYDQKSIACFLSLPSQRCR